MKKITSLAAMSILWMTVQGLTGCGMPVPRTEEDTVEPIGTDVGNVGDQWSEGGSTPCPAAQKPDCSAEGLGICKGKMVPECNPETKEWSCSNKGVEGYVPMDTACDGIDSDCDGVDDKDESWESLKVTDVCPLAKHGVCADVKFVCTEKDGKYEFECRYEELENFTWDERFIVDEEELAKMCQGAADFASCMVDPATLGKWCDMEDNDCDGETDEPLLFTFQAQLSREEFEASTFVPCGPFTGVCRVGKDYSYPEEAHEQGLLLDENSWVGLKCQDGELMCMYSQAVVEAGYQEGEETLCDLLDNDCDGRTDEVTDPKFSDCPHLGVCEGKTEALCLDGEWRCLFENMFNDPLFEYPRETLCDGYDNDCDGLTDEFLQWPQECVVVDEATGKESIDCESELCKTYHPACAGSVPPVFTDCPFTHLGQVGTVKKQIHVPDLDIFGDPILAGVCAKKPEDGMWKSEVRTSCEPVDVDKDGKPDGSIWMCNYDDVTGYVKPEFKKGKVDETLCDGLDNDCDGVVDGSVDEKGAVSYIWSGSPDKTPCRSLGVCAGAFKAYCNKGGNAPGQWSCEYTSPLVELPKECDIDAPDCIWTETKCDGLDNDCDGLTDEELDGKKVALEEACAEYIGNGVCTPEFLNTRCGKKGEDEEGNPIIGFICDPSGIPTWAEKEDGNPELCDGLDNDCDGQTDEEIRVVLPKDHEKYDTGCPYVGECKHDVWAVCETENPVEGKGTWWCDFSKHKTYDSGVFVLNGVTYEIRCDGLDNDCDGETDEGSDMNDKDWPIAGEKNPFAQSGCKTQGQCEKQKNLLHWRCEKVDGVPKFVCDYSDIAGYEDPEASCDGADNDCDGETDELLFDPGPNGAGCRLVGQCNEENVTAACVVSEDGVPTWVCDYSQVPAWEEVESLCDGLDNDCDGRTDTPLDWKTSANGCKKVGVCDHPALFGVCNGEKGWDCLYSLVPDYESPEESCDGKDNNCDGKTDINVVDDLEKGVCKWCEPCTEDAQCETGYCVSLPDPNDKPGDPFEGQKRCSIPSPEDPAKNPQCAYIDYGTGECGTVPKGKFACGDSRTPCTCGAMGIWFCFTQEAQKCKGATPVCFEGACVACLPGKKRCTGNTIETCSSDGKLWKSSGICAGGQICMGEGKCVTNDEFKINTIASGKTAGSNVNPAVAVLSNGGFVVVWGSENPGPGGSLSDVLARIYDSQLEPITPKEFTANTPVTGNQSNPDVAAFPGSEGGFIVVWQGDEGGNQGIFAQMFTNDGAKKGDSFQVNKITLDHQVNPSVAVLSSGGFVIVWEDYNISSKADAPDIVGQVYQKDGSAWLEKEVVIHAWQKDKQLMPAIAVLGPDLLVGTWTSKNQIDGRDVFYRSFDAGLTPLMLSELAVNVYQKGTQHRSKIAGFTGEMAGWYVIAWDSFNQDATNTTGVYFQIFSPDGIPIAADDIGANTYTAGNQADADVAVLDDNSIVLAWEAQNIPGEEPVSLGIAARVFNSTGDGLEPVEFLVNQTVTGDQTNPDVAAIPGKGYIIVWYHKNAEEGEHDIYGRVFKVD